MVLGAPIYKYILFNIQCIHTLTLGNIYMKTNKKGKNHKSTTDLRHFIENPVLRKWPDARIITLI